MVRSIRAAADQEEIANLFQKYNYSSLPVVDDFGKLVGRVTSDDVLDVIQEEATEDMHRMVGISGDETVFTPGRGPFAIACLGYASISRRGSALPGSFPCSSRPSKNTPSGVLPSHRGPYWGNAGNQTLTIVVRSLALGEIEDREWRRMLIKEFFTGCTTGFAVGGLAGLVFWIWIGKPILGVVVALAMLLNMIAAAAAVLVPISLRLKDRSSSCLINNGHYHD